MASSLLRSLIDLVGAAHCLAGADRAPFVVDGRTPCAVVFPGSVDEVVGVVRAAAVAGVALLPWGGGTQMGLGAPPREGALVVSTRRLRRVVEHAPGDLTATAEAGITLDALQEALGARGQWWPLDPPVPGEATLGGVLATNAAGPCRHAYGTARDLVIGLRVVTAEGQVVRGGGKVVKNVAGYDLVKLYIGALGTLGIVVEATLKLRPRAEAAGACWAAFPDLATAAEAAAALAGSELGPAALELLDAAVAAACAARAGVDLAPGPALVVVFDGLSPTVLGQQAEALGRLRAAGARAVTELDGAQTGRALGALRGVRRAVGDPVAVATATVLPADIAAYLEDAQRAAHGTDIRIAASAHAGQGVVTLLLLPAGVAGAPATTVVGVLSRCREAARARGGHLVLDGAALAVREGCPAWDPPGPAWALMQGIKARLDPEGRMNPGRFVGGL
jgi:glycolate oxidase FAD binding subunit